MGSVEAQRIPEAVKEEVKNMLNPYFTRDYRDDVRNPVLLLNFLHQHAIISKPVYNIRADPEKMFHFIGSCTLEPFTSEESVVSCSMPALTTEAEAGSKRECKNMAAQKILNLFLENETTNSKEDNAKDQQASSLDLEIQEISDRMSEEFVLCELMGAPFTNKTENFYEDDLSGVRMFDDFVVDVKSDRSKRRRKKRTKKSSKSSATETETETMVVVDPQFGGECSRGAAGGFDDFVVDVKSDPSKRRRKKRTKKSSKSSETETMVVADPQCGGKCSRGAAGGSSLAEKNVYTSSKGSSSSSTAGRHRTGFGSVAEYTTIDNATLKELSSATTLGKWLSEDEPQCKTKRMSSSRLRNIRRRATNKLGSSSSSSSLSSTSSSSSRSSGDRKLSRAPPSVEDVFENFFDPFSKLRPKIISYLNSSQKENFLTVAVADNENTAAVAGTVEAQSKVAAEFVPLQNSKTPFQILQERAVKHFKLIPRSRIDKVGEAFTCNLILDSHTGYGEGRTKKEAKVKAAIHILQQLEEVAKSDDPSEVTKPDDPSDVTLDQSVSSN